LQAVFLRRGLFFPYNPPVELKTLKELAAEIGAELIGDGSAAVSSVSTLDEARPGQLGFLSNPKYQKQLQTTQASAVIVGNDIVCDRLNLLRAKDPHLAMQKAVVALHGHRRHRHCGVHPRAVVDETARVGAGTVVYPGAFIGADVTLGSDCVIYPNAVIYDGCVIGDRVIIHAGAVIGADGFGYATSAGVHHKIPQIGNVIIEDDVEVGANSTIDRAALGSTFIGKGTKIDNLVALGHNVRVGPGCLLVAQVGVAGSTTLGHHVVLGGQVGIAGHLEIGDMVMAAGQCGISGSVEPSAVIGGSPHMPLREARRVYTLLRELPAIVKRVKDLENAASQPNEGE
jgi:UDP-3-O-[3-hydroxymyristoyl] glucosamine N-acyltransferase